MSPKVHLWRKMTNIRSDNYHRNDNLDMIMAMIVDGDDNYEDDDSDVHKMPMTVMIMTMVVDGDNDHEDDDNLNDPDEDGDDNHVDDDPYYQDDDHNNVVTLVK